MACSPTSGMELWLKPESLSGDSGDPVTSWPSSVNGHTAVDGAGGTPEISPTLFNGFKGVKFNGTNFLEIASTAELNFPDGYTLFIVHNDVAPSSGVHTLIAKDDGYDKGVWAIYRKRRSTDIPSVDTGCHDIEGYNTQEPLHYWWYDEISWYETVYTDNNDGSPRIYGFRWGNEGDRPTTRQDAWADGQLTDTFRDSAGHNGRGPGYRPFCPENQTGSLYVGHDGFWGGSGGAEGTIWEILIYPGHLTDEQVATTNNYLRNKYQVTKPTRSYSAPTIVGAATFSNTYTWSAPPGTQAGDTMFFFVTHYTADTVDTANAPTGYAGPTPFAYYVPQGFLGLSVGFEDGGSTQRVRVLKKVAHGSGESWTFKDFNDKTSPDNPHTVKIVSIRGASSGDLAGVGSAYEGLGFSFAGGAPTKPPQGLDFTVRDYSYNFEYEDAEYLGWPPGGIVDFSDTHSIDPVHITNENSLILLSDFAVWSSQSFTPPAGFTEIDDADSGMLAYKIAQPGSSDVLTSTASAACRWVQFAFVFEGVSEAIDDEAIPTCAERFDCQSINMEVA